MTSAGRLQDKVAVVTGAARGIGAATAALMVAEGARVVVADLDEAGAARVADTLGAAAVAATADVRSEQDVARLVALAVERFGRLDVFHGNAVAVDDADTDAVSTPDDVWRRTFDVVVMSAVHAFRHAVPAMLETGGGSLVHTSSLAARNATGSRTAYGTMKAALEALSMYAANSLGPQGVRSNVVAPGFVLTENTRALFDEDGIERFASAAAAGRLCLPEDVADVVVFLASDAARYVSGQVVVVDGGGKRALAW